MGRLFSSGAAQVEAAGKRRSGARRFPGRAPVRVPAQGN